MDNIITYYVSAVDDTLYSGDMQEGDSVATQEQIDAWFNRPSALEEQQKAFTDAIEAHLNAFVRTRGYDDVNSMAKYNGCKVARFAREFEYVRDAVAETWDMGYAILNAVMDGERPMPTIEEVLAELPTLEWPV